MKSAKPNFRPSIGLAASAIAWSVLGCGLLWLATWAMFGDSISRIGFINAFGWPIALFVLLAAIALLLRRKWIGAALGLVLGGIITFQAFGLNPAAMFGDTKSAGSTRIVSASLRTHNQDMASAARMIAAHSPDIITLQEASDLNAFKAELEQVSGEPWNAVSERNFATLSRMAVRKGADDDRNWVSSEVDLGGKWIEIWNLHAPKNFARPGSNSAYFVDLVDAINAKQPDLVLGDFNATPWNFGYGAVGSVMENAHRNAGFGPGLTFPARGRRLGLLGATSRIDHIFYNGQHTATYASTGKASLGSDHHPVIADIQF